MNEGVALDLATLVVVAILGATALVGGAIMTRWLLAALNDQRKAVAEPTDDRNGQLSAIGDILQKQSQAISGLEATLAARVEELGHSFEKQQARMKVVTEDGCLKRLKITTGVPLGFRVNRSKSEREPDVYTAKQQNDVVSFRRVNVPYYHYYTADRQLHLQDDWNQPFGAIADPVIESGTTHLLHDRLYTLWQGVRSAARSGAPMVEVGAWRGGSTKFLAEASRHFGKTGAIYCCDTFTGPVQVTPELDGTRTAAQFEDLYHEATALLAPYPDLHVIRGDIEETASQITDRALSLLHVDVNMYRATNFVLTTFGPRVEAGGIVVVDDYGSVTCPGVKQAVDEFVSMNDRFRLVHLLTGQALLVSLGSA